MTLSRTPLRASKEHEVELTDTSGTWGQYRCTRCGDSRSELIPKVESGERDPLPWPCTGLKRSGLQRNKRVNPVSDRREEKRAHQRDEGFRDHVRRLACVSCGSAPPNDPHHRRSRGAGFGDWLEDGTGNLLPLCRVCHQTLHRKGVESFQYEQGINLEREARRIGGEYREREAG